MFFKPLDVVKMFGIRDSGIVPNPALGIAVLGYPIDCGRSPIDTLLQYTHYTTHTQHNSTITHNNTTHIITK